MRRWNGWGDEANGLELPATADAFLGFPKTNVLMAVRWYVAYALVFGDIEELMNERGVKVDPIIA